MAKELIVRYDRGILYKNKVFTYEDEDIATSVAMGRRCEAFVQKETQTFGVDGEDESETKPVAINICKQVAAVGCTTTNTHTSAHLPTWTGR